jgi:hypothetical protein
MDDGEQRLAHRAYLANLDRLNLAKDHFIKAHKLIADFVVTEKDELVRLLALYVDEAKLRKALAERLCSEARRLTEGGAWDS